MSKWSSNRKYEMIYSPTAQHALRALIYLARNQKNDVPVRVSEIAESENIPRQFLSKILHDLRNKGLVAATKGPGGGFNLAKPASKITISNVVEAVDGIQNFDTRCILGLHECSDQAPCALHKHWKKMRSQLSSAVATMTLEDAARSVS